MVDVAGGRVDRCVYTHIRCAACACRHRFKHLLRREVEGLARLDTHLGDASRRANRRTCRAERVGVPGCEGLSTRTTNFQAGQQAHLPSRVPSASRWPCRCSTRHRTKAKRIDWRAGVEVCGEVGGGGEVPLDATP